MFPHFADFIASPLLRIDPTPENIPGWSSHDWFTSRLMITAGIWITLLFALFFSFVFSIAERRVHIVLVVYQAYIAGIERNANRLFTPAA